MTLRSESSVIIENVIEARSFIARGIGLLGKKSLALKTALWLKPCNNIHTFFMRFPIDVIFVDKDLKVKALYENVKPGRIIWYVPGAHSAFELTAGQLQNFKLNKGDQLHVGH